MTQIKDDKFEKAESDIEKIQTKPSQYIGPLGSMGALHIAKECVNNAIDECINKYSNGNHVEIFLDESTNTFIAKDNGRGMPFNIMEDACTILQSSTKFTREGGGGTSAGENGCGIKATNALSDLFQIVSVREGKKATLTFNRGKKQGELEITKADKKEHGTTFTFIPSEIFLGKGCRIKADELYTWMNKIHFICPSNITMDLIIYPKGKETVKSYTFKNNKNGLVDYLVENNKDKEKVSNIVGFQNSMNIEEIITRKKDSEEGKIGDTYNVNRILALDVAFMYTDDNALPFTDSFCNFVNTTENGVHYDACKKAIIDYLIKETTKTINARDSKSLSITPKDVENNLSLVINLNTDLNPQFVAQIKNRVGNGELFAPIRALCKKSLIEYFDKNPSTLKSVTSCVKLNAKVRLAGQLAKTHVIKENKDALSKYKIKNLIPANNKNGYLEIFAVEGDSAGNEAARYNNNIQAIYKFRGYPPNGFGKTLTWVLTKAELKGLVTALGCNIGSKFNINNLVYDKIIIMTDSDSDGYGISNYIFGFFYYHLRDIIKAGKLYKVISPLYKLQGKNGKGKDNIIFVRNKMEYVEKFEENISEHITVFDDKRKMSREELRRFLFINRNYLELLRKLERHLQVHRDLIEFLLMYIDDKKIEKKLKKKFPEMTLSDNILVGVYEGRYQLLVIDEVFMENMKLLFKLRKENDNKLIYNAFDDNTGKTYTDITVGELLFMCEKYQPKVLTRYKGLGEMTAEELRETTFNPNNRELIRMTIDDTKEEFDKLDTLVGDNLEARKELYQSLDVDLDILDN